MAEQRNSYKGTPPRPWIRAVVVGADGATKHLDLLADTGNPCAVIVSTETLRQFNLGLTPGMSTNFGPLEGGWLRIRVPEIGFDEDVLAYGGHEVVLAARASHNDFEGLVGLPLLRMMEYGGDRDEFWLRSITST